MYVCVVVRGGGVRGQERMERARGKEERKERERGKERERERERESQREGEGKSYIAGFLRGERDRILEGLVSDESYTLLYSGALCYRKDEIYKSDTESANLYWQNDRTQNLDSRMVRTLL